VPETNSLGLGLFTAKTLDQAYQALKSGLADTLVVLENDLYRREIAGRVNEIIEAAQNLVVIDHLENQTTRKAGLIFPAATFAESDGTFINNEGRAQCFYQVFVPEGEIQESWRWLRDMISATGSGERSGWQDRDHVLAALVETYGTVFAPVLEIAPAADFRMDGTKLPRQPHRYSGRTAMRAQIDVHEPKPADDPDTPLAFSMEGYKGREMPPELIARYWSPGWNSVQALNKFQGEVGGPLRGGDPGRRLIEPPDDGHHSYFEDIPGAFQIEEGRWLVMPRHHIFGSEPLSMHTPGIRELAPEPYLALHPDSAAGLQIEAGDRLSLEVRGVKLALSARLDESLPQGLVALPAGLPELAYIDLPAWSTAVQPLDKE
jgi:NADH-quinone oxidoreductase subunit G